MFDVVIVGGGVAGCHLASRLNGLNVLLIEKNKNILLKDSGIVSKDFLDYHDRRLIKNEICRMELNSPGGRKIVLQDDEPFAYILKRDTFSKYLRLAARKNAKIVYETVTGITYGDNFAVVHTDGGAYQTKLVVGADGANSIVRRYAGLPSPFLSLGVFVKTQGKISGDIQVFLNKYYSPDFFSWIIPQNNEYGLITALKSKEYLDYFRKHQLLSEGKVYAYLIPTGYVKSYSKRTLLVGDSCGQNKPLTGGGIIFGLKSANCAATVIKECFDSDTLTERALGVYEKYWKKDLAWEIDKQFLFRMLYRNTTNRQIEKIFTTIGSDVEKLRGFDYDKISRSWIRLPKTKLIGLAVSMVFG